MAAEATGGGLLDNGSVLCLDAACSMMNIMKTEIALRSVASICTHGQSGLEGQVSCSASFVGPGQHQGVEHRLPELRFKANGFGIRPGSRCFWGVLRILIRSTTRVSGMIHACCSASDRCRIQDLESLATWRTIFKATLLGAFCLRACF